MLYNKSMKTIEETKKHVKELVDKKGYSYNFLSIKLGKNQTYLQKFIKEKSPRRLDEDFRKKLASFLMVDEQELTDIPLQKKVSTVYKVGFVQAGKFNSACQLPEDEWQEIPYPQSEAYKNCHLFALGVRGDSMNLVFAPEKTTLICCPFEEWVEINTNQDIEGKYIIAYRKDKDGNCEATVKKYTKIDNKTIILVAESTNPEIKPIVLHPDNNEYEIAAVVIGDIRIY